jgi:polyphosphate glucokinase
VVLGGGNVKKLKKLPLGAELGNNKNAFRGGFRLWESEPSKVPAHRKKRHSQNKS